MKTDPRRFFRPADGVILLAVLLTAFILFMFPRGQAQTAEIYRSGEKILTVDLASVKEPYTLDAGGSVTLLIEKNAVSFRTSDCRNQLCVHTGRLTKAGDTAACIPNGILIKVTGSAKYDAMTGS